jgi:phytoene dehydrogenase-like protein
VAQYSYYTGGGYFIKGGSGRLSDYLAKVISDNGGKVITKAEVFSCSTDEVEYVSKKEKHRIKSDKIISNLSPEDSYRLFNQPYKESRAIGNSLLTIYLGFSKNIKEVYGKRAYSNFIFDELDSIDDLNAMMQKEMPKRSFVFVDYSQLDSGLTKDKHKSFGAICMMDSLTYWETLDDDAYREQKEALIAVMLKKLERSYPNISELVEYAEVGTAKTVKRYIKTPNGTAYGFKPTPKAFFRIPKIKSSKIKNLYFVGQWVIAGGFSPTIVSGGVCYEKIRKELK